MNKQKRICKLIVTIKCEQDLDECSDDKNAEFIANYPIDFLDSSLSIFTGQVEDEDGNILAQ